MESSNGCGLETLLRCTYARPSYDRGTWLTIALESLWTMCFEAVPSLLSGKGRLWLTLHREDVSVVAWVGVLLCLFLVARIIYILLCTDCDLGSVG